MTDVAPAETPASARAGLRWWREVAYGIAVYLVYSAVRNRFGSAGGDPGPAYEHALEIIDVEKWLHLYVEPAVQRWYLDLPGRGLIRAWNVYYGLAHFLVTLLALMWLFRRDPQRYPLWRNTLALTTCLAVIGFAAYSLMPPRLLDDPGEYGACQIYLAEEDGGASAILGDGERRVANPSRCDRYDYVDTVDRYGGWISFGNDGYKEVSNQYAAMPSMHIGWSTWVALVLVPMARRRWTRWLAVAYPLLTLFCIVVTGNHYWIDGLGGLACLGVGFLIARWLTAKTRARSARSREPADGSAVEA